MEETNIQAGINYKINENGTYKVIGKVWNGKTYYNIPLQQKKYDGTIENFERPVTFYGCEPPQNGDYIKIISGFESNYQSKRDKYSWITTIVIQDYIKVENNENPIVEYQQKVPQEYENIEITSSDLPF